MPSKKDSRDFSDIWEQQFQHSLWPFNKQRHGIVFAILVVFKSDTIEDDLIEIFATYLPQPALQAPFSASIEPNCKIDCFFIHQSISLLRPTWETSWRQKSFSSFAGPAFDWHRLPSSLGSGRSSKSKSQLIGIMISGIFNLEVLITTCYVCWKFCH